MRTRVLAPGLSYGTVVALAVAGCVPATAQEGARSPRAVVEVALTEVSRGDGVQAYIASDDALGELLVLDSSAGGVRRLTDSLAWWGKPVTLRDGGSAPVELQGVHVDQRGGVIGVASASGVGLFKSDGTQLCGNDELRPALDIAGLRADLWAVSLIRRGGRELAEAGVSLEDGTPRVVVVDQRCRVVGEGLGTTESESISASAAAGRVLLLSADERQFFAVEAANYRVYQLDRELRPRAELVDPGLLLEDGWSQGQGEEDVTLVASRAREQAGDLDHAVVPPDPSRPQASAAFFRPVAMTLHWVPVVSDVEWDPVEGRLLILLSDQVSGRIGVLDLLDTTTGEVERFLLELCEGCPEPPRPLSRLAVTKGFVWMSTARAGGPVYRLDRGQLRGGERLRLVDELAPQPPPEEPDAEAAEPEPVPAPR